MIQPLLEISHLCGGYIKDENILQDISLSVLRGEAVGIIGLNGSGKSTLARALMNLLPQRSGSIVFKGDAVEGLSAHALSRAGMALMHQGGSVFPNLSVQDNLRLAFEGVPTSGRERLASVIPLLYHQDRRLMHSMADRLSGGECQTLSLAMTLARSPQLVILDEPSAGLSPVELSALYGILSRLRETLGISILLIEQNITRAVDFCDRVLLMESGRLVAEFKEKNIKEIETVLFKND